MQGVPVYLCKAYRTSGLTHFLALNWSKWSGISNLQLWSGPLIHPVFFRISSEEAASLSIDSAFCSPAYHGGFCSFSSHLIEIRVPIFQLDKIVFVPYDKGRLKL